MQTTRYALLALVAAACTGKAAPAPFIPGDGTDTSDVDTDEDPVIDTEDTPQDTEDTLPGGFVDNCEVPDGPGLAGVCNQSVNNADVVAPTASDGALVITTAGGASPIGSFNGRGTGNRALAGFHAYTGTRVNAIGNLSYDGKQITGPRGLDFVLVVDLECSGTGPFKVLTAPFELLTSEVIDATEEINRFSAIASAEVWYATLGLDAPDGTEVMIDRDVGATDGLPGARLSVLEPYWPNACVRNIVSEDPEMPVTTRVSGVMLSLGRGSDSLNRNEWRVSRVEFSGDIHLPPE
jgi:hypothetical protein